jgi:hypothetical protein
MTHSIKYFKAALVALCLLTSFNTKGQNVIDQFDTTYNGGMSARTLQGYSWYQTFTAGLSGNMDRIDIGFFNAITAVGTLEVFEGFGRSGLLIYTGQYNVNCPSGGCMIPFPVNCSLVAGNPYTFHFSPDSGFPDPYGVQVDYTNSYPGGEAFIIDPSGVYPLNMDFIFMTYMKVEGTGIADETVDIKSLFKIIENSVVLSRDVRGDLFTLSGQKLKMHNLNHGMYFLRITYMNKIFIQKIYL